MPNDTPPKAIGGEDRTTDRLGRLIERAHFMNLIHRTLRSTRKVSEIYPIILGTLVSPQGMGFSRAVVLRWDEAQARYLGHAGLGAAEAEAHRTIQRELSEELKRIRADSGHASEANGGDSDEASLYWLDLAEMGEERFWQTIFDQYARHNPGLDRIGLIRIREKYTDDQGEPIPSFLERFFASRRSEFITAAEMEASPLHRELKQTLGADMLWSMIQTQRGTRLIIIVDKMFEAEPIDDIDRMHLDWFISQVSLAMENAELIEELMARTEALEELDTLKSNFLSTISHELRTPLTAISGFTRLMIDNRVGPVSPSQREILERVLVQADGLTNIVNDLIEIVEIDSGATLQLQLHPIDPLNVLMSALPKLDPRRATKTVQVEPVVTAPIPQILGDEKALERVFYHLLDNAIKFSPDGGTVRIEFETGPRDLSISITDAGIGIPADRLKQIFEAFYQVDSQLTRAHEGMGVGLTLTRKLIANLGGRITVESEPDRGTKFTVILPIAIER